MKPEDPSCVATSDLITTMVRDNPTDVENKSVAVQEQSSDSQNIQDQNRVHIPDQITVQILERTSAHTQDDSSVSQNIQDQKGVTQMSKVLSTEQDSSTGSSEESSDSSDSDGDSGSDTEDTNQVSTPLLSHVGEKCVDYTCVKEPTTDVNNEQQQQSRVNEEERLTDKENTQKSGGEAQFGEDVQVSYKELYF